MRYASIKAAIMIAAGILGLCLYFVACDGKKPVGPEEPKDYVVYFRDNGVNGSYYGYHPTTGQLDTFMIPAHALLEMAVSADGTKLYARGMDSIGVVDLETLELVKRLPYALLGEPRCASLIAFSPDNSLVAIQGKELYILSTTDFSVVYHDTIWTWGGSFNRDSERFYCCGGRDDRCVYILDFDSGPSVTKKQFSDPPAMVKVIPAIDESKWFLLRGLGYGCRAFFQVYDSQIDSLIFQEELVPAAGSMSLTPDGQYLFYSTPNFEPYCSIAPSYLTVFDVEKNRIAMLISTVGFIDGFNPVYMPVRDLAMTPDGQWLIAGDGGGAYSIGAPTFLVFNIKTMAIESYVDIPRVAGLHYTCQNAS